MKTLREMKNENKIMKERKRETDKTKFKKARGNNMKKKFEKYNETT